LLERLPDSSDSVLQKTLLLQYNLQIGRLPRENLRLDLAELNSLPRGWIRHRAQMAQATAYVLSGKVNEALRILNVDVGRGTEFDDSFRHLQRARLLYGQKRFDEALDSVSMVPRSSPSWFGATQVAAWAAYRLGDDNLALGQLMNFHNPYLAAKYSPESWLLQASSLYRLCYLNSASTSLAELESRYGEMAVVLSKFSRELGNRFTGVTTVLGYARGNRRPPAGYGAREWALLMDGLLQNEVLRSTEQFMLSSQQGERQVRGLEQRLGNNARGRFVRAQLQRYGSEIQAARREAVRLGFRALSRRLIELRNDLADVLEASLAVDLEINTRIRDRLLRSDLPAARDLDVDAELADGFDFWPFEGEYWRDEIGSYYFALNSACGETER
jgi:hypothetical protein